MRNAVLDWSLKLENTGILGDALTFSPEEKKKAASAATVRSRRVSHLAEFVLIITFGIFASLLAEVAPRFFRDRATQNRLEPQLATALKALQQDSAQATGLLKTLQGDLQERTSAIHQIEAELKLLQEQRKLLDLTPEQKEALQTLVRRQLTVSEIFTSLDFWLGRVLPSAFFFLLGILCTLYFNRRSKVKLSPPPPSNHHAVSADAAQEPPPSQPLK